MFLTILGSGPANAIPREGCKCALCRDARHGKKSARTRSSILIQDEKNSALIDTSPDFLLQAARENIQKIDAVFFTHEHSDATGGFNDFIKWRQARGQNPRIFAEEAIINYLRRKFLNALKIPPPTRVGDSLLQRERKPSPFSKGGLRGIFLTHLPPFSKTTVGNIILESFPVRHGMGKAVPTLGYRINNKTIFISDFDGIPPQSAKYLRGAKTMILDAAMWFGRKMKGHNTPKEAIAIAKKFNPRILYLTQTGHTWPPHDEAQRKIREYAKKTKN
ncbi:MAG: MBL fold metallo-hydrolase [Patescibacteria group bacterium]|mgnify:CR=1 FL=1